MLESSLKVALPIGLIKRAQRASGKDRNPAKAKQFVVQEWFMWSAV